MVEVELVAPVQLQQLTAKLETLQQTPRSYTSSPLYTADLISSLTMTECAELLIKLTNQVNVMCNRNCLQSCDYN